MGKYFLRIGRYPRTGGGKLAVATSQKLDGFFTSDDIQSETQSIEHKCSTTELYVQSQYYRQDL